MSNRGLLRFIIFVFLFGASFSVSAQVRQESPAVCIVDEITADSVNVIEMPDGLWELINYSDGSENKRERPVNPRPFTVQVYGDKSRNEANSRAAKVQARFPQYYVRRHYSSPYFRVYLGAFETSRDAQALVNQVKKAFPAFANEVHWTKTSIGSSRKR